MAASSRRFFWDGVRPCLSSRPFSLPAHGSTTSSTIRSNKCIATRSSSNLTAHLWSGRLERRDYNSYDAKSSSSLLLNRHHHNHCRRFISSSSPSPSLESSSSLTSLEELDNPYCNIPSNIAQRANQTPKLYQRSPHPLATIQSQIHDYFGSDYAKIDSLSPLVSTESNFDSLLIPPDHVSRSKSDTYYLSQTQCLRTHTSAHQVELLKQGHTQFLCTGDVYRRDDIDKSHYPIFHQMEGVKVFDEKISQDAVMEDLQATLEGLAQHLFGPVDCRWVEEYFPFTHPSVELEIKYQGEWLEVLGCGVMRPEILQNSGISSQKAWAFGLGLERLAMILFDIPDIRLFWSDDKRFWNQFQDGQVTRFQPYSKYPPCFKDVSFWILDSAAYDTQDVLDLTRNVAGDLVEEVELVDEFVHPKTQRQSLCFRITYRSMDRSLTNSEIDVLQEELRTSLQDQLPIELR